MLTYDSWTARGGGVGDQQGGRCPREKCVEPDTTDVTIEGNLCSDPPNFRCDVPNLLDYLVEILATRHSDSGRRRLFVSSRLPCSEFASAERH